MGFSRFFIWLGGRELTVMCVVLALAGSVWAFAEIADAVTEGDTHEFDRRVLLMMRSAGDVSDPIGPDWAEEVGRDVTALGSNVILTLLTLIVMGYLVLCQRRRLAVVVLVSSLGSLCANSLLKDAYERDRPDLVPHGTEVYTASFPSGHSMVAAATYLTLAVLLARAEKRRRLRAYYLISALTITLLVGMSRLYLGVHWPTDVLAGWTGGAGWALACWLLAGWLQRRGQVEPESVDHVPYHSVSRGPNTLSSPNRQGK
ncbi:phosphatase PAP2 family protein [Gilvimarinus sp. SDUM040013]|uniref:undecaprenyl-diphosphate phosphatase n=1 Tax=Gilvimarinus gilvus TaxID=3058038 RepID=A0ABU4RYN2_9GAMM|nr:phosphatase PAP2 family protein [Gilvimarinus sp. SDUM040013]MDO3386322.1 phosphatase PAP2 family protein [Gilvimarinus sp. SDUM040013]MDX6850020.1 phosphatase PAP2 family protein [Gilvimarinus sp. SDUM040013]